MPTPESVAEFKDRAKTVEGDWGKDDVSLRKVPSYY